MNRRLEPTTVVLQGFYRRCCALVVFIRVLAGGHWSSRLTTPQGSLRLTTPQVRPATAPPRMNSSALVGSSLVELRLSLGLSSKRYQEAVRPDLNRTKSLKSHADGPPAAKSVATYPKFRSLCRLSLVFWVDLFGVTLVLFRLLALK